MSLQVAHLGTGTFDIPLQPDTAGTRLDTYDIRDDVGGKAFSRVIVTPQHLDPTAVGLTALEDAAMYAGILTGHGENRESLTGYGMPYLLGEDNGGALWNAAVATSSGATVATHITNRVVVAPNNGIISGSINASATTFALRFKPGVTRRQILATICTRRGYEWRINADGTLDVDTAANLFTSGEVMLVDEGGRDGAITGVSADLAIDGIDVDGFATEQYIDWEDDGSTMGSATITPPAAWDAPDGDAIVWRNYMTASSKGKLRDPDDVDKVTAFINHNQANASTDAAAILARKNTYRLTVTAEIDEHNPLGVIQPGDTAYVYDQQLRLYDTATQLYYRGQVVFPASLRVVEMDVPIRPEYGVYVVTGAGTVVDVTEDVLPEDRQCVITLGTRRRYTRRRPKRRATNRRRNRHIARMRVFAQRLAASR